MRIGNVGNLVASIVVWLASCSLVRADIITFGPTSYSIPGGPFFLLTPSDGGFTGTPPRPIFAVGEIGPIGLDVPRFNVSQGQLTKVTFDLVAANPSAGAVDINVLPLAINPMIRFTSEVRAVGPNGLLLSAGATTFHSLPAGPATITGVGLAAPLTTSLNSITDPTQLLNFTGIGSFHVDLIKHLESFPSPSTFVSTRITDAGSASGTFAVTYEFSAIPEPATWLLSSILGIGMFLKIRPRTSRRSE